MDKSGLGNLEARGFALQEHFVRDFLDGISATLPLAEGLRLEIYRGCSGIYKLRGQGRGRPKKHELVDYDWFDPHWAILERVGHEWRRVADGSQVSVDLAVEQAQHYLRKLYPQITVPDA